VAFVFTGIPLAITTPDGNLTRLGVLAPAVLWPAVAVTAYRAIRAGDVERHRKWMARLYALTFFAITARMVTPLLLLAQVPVMQSRYDGDVRRGEREHPLRAVARLDPQPGPGRVDHPARAP
jgi:hypothetical protein